MSETAMIHLTTDGDTYRMNNVDVHPVTIQSDVLTEIDPRTLVGKTIVLDGNTCVVTGVEAKAVLWYPGNPALSRVGISVAPCNV